MESKSNRFYREMLTYFISSFYDVLRVLEVRQGHFPRDWQINGQTIIPHFNALVKDVRALSANDGLVYRQGLTTKLLTFLEFLRDNFLNLQKQINTHGGVKGWETDGSVKISSTARLSDIVAMLSLAIENQPALEENIEQAIAQLKRSTEQLLEPKTFARDIKHDLILFYLLQKQIAEEKSSVQAAPTITELPPSFETTASLMSSLRKNKAAPKMKFLQFNPGLNESLLSSDADTSYNSSDDETASNSSRDSNRRLSGGSTSSRETDLNTSFDSDVSSSPEKKAKGFFSRAKEKLKSTFNPRSSTTTLSQ